MVDLAVLVNQVSTPVKVAWLVWLVWSVIQIGWHRWAGVTASLVAVIVPRPAPGPRLEADGVAQVLSAAQAPPPASPPTFRHRRRRRRPGSTTSTRGSELTV
jgi:hypothetical protein